MKHSYRILAILMALLLLLGMFSAVAEMEVELEAPREAEDLNLDISPDELTLTDELELVSEEAEPAPQSNAAEPTEANSKAFWIDSNGMLVRYKGSAEFVVIPDNVTVIGYKAFAGNTTMESVRIPEGVTVIQGKAFENCTKLARVTVLAKNIKIGESAFNGETPAFYTVIGSTAAEWARAKHFRVEDDLVVLYRDTSMTVNVGDTLWIYLKDANAKSYASSNSAVATVSTNGTVKVLSSGRTDITVQLDGGGARVLSLTAGYPRARLSSDSVTLNVGERKTISVQNLGNRSVSWSSSNANVATVNGGTITAVRAGSCTVTAALSDGSALKCQVTVRDNAYLSKEKITLNVGSTYTLTVKNRGNRSVVWSSSDSNIASVSNGKVTAKKAGRCTVTAQVSNGGALKCLVIVNDPVKISRGSINLKVGDSFTLTVSNRGNRSVRWSSSNTNVATVNGGKVTARNAGSCTITATLSDGKKLTCKVNVTASAAPAFSRSTLKLKVGQTFRLVINNRGRNSATWSSSNSDIATVDRTGTVTAKKVGKCVIYAKLTNGTLLKCDVIVRQR